MLSCPMAVYFDGMVFCDYYDFGVIECGTFSCPEEDKEEDREEEEDRDYDEEDDDY